MIQAAIYVLPSLVNSEVPAKDLFPGYVLDYPVDDVAIGLAVLKPNDPLTLRATDYSTD